MKNGTKIKCDNMPTTKTNLEYWMTATVDASPAYKDLYKEEEQYLRSNVKKDAKVLDVACGNGRNLAQIKDLSKNLYGLDHDLVAEKAFSKLLKPNEAKFVLGDAEKMPFDNDLFDLVYCFSAFHNLGNEKINVLKEMKRVTKRDGYILLPVHSEKALNERMNLYKKINVPITKIKGTTVYFDPSLGDTISEQFTKKQIESLAKETGLKIVEIKELEIAYLVKMKK